MEQGQGGSLYRRALVFEVEDWVRNEGRGLREYWFIRNSPASRVKRCQVQEVQCQVETRRLSLAKGKRQRRRNTRSWIQRTESIELARPYELLLGFLESSCAFSMAEPTVYSGTFSSGDIIVLVVECPAIRIPQCRDLMLSVPTIMEFGILSALVMSRVYHIVSDSVVSFQTTCSLGASTVVGRLDSRFILVFPLNTARTDKQARAWSDSQYQN